MMKRGYYLLLIFLVSIIPFANGNAQLLKKIGKRAEQKVNQRANQKVDNTIDKALDKTEDATKKDAAKKKNSQDNKDDAAGKSGTDQAGFKINTKFDFVAGEKVMALDDFSRVNTGDFPSQWNTNGSGEVVTIDGQPGKWLEIKGNFTYYPEFIKSLPDNFTIEFDAIYNYAEKNLERNILGFYFIGADKATRDDPVFKYGFNKPGKNGGGVEFHSYQPNTLEIFTWKNKQLNLNTKNVSQADFVKSMRDHVNRISIWRQKERVRVYLNDKKIVDVPRLLAETDKINMFKIGFEDWENAGRAYISNFRFAESTPDMRSKLITEGKFVTSGIYFNSGSDKIRAESYGILRQIAEILKSDPSVKIKIVGHTDNDGGAASNLELSKKRAVSVKEVLTKEYGIPADRMETDGLGETKPIAPNTTDEGKANNRRVEFIKL